jgi:hypothetical protein
VLVLTTMIVTITIAVMAIVTIAVMADRHHRRYGAPPADHPDHRNQLGNPASSLWARR